MALQPQDAREYTQLCGGGGFSSDFPTDEACRPRSGLGRGRDLVVPHFLDSSGLVQIAAVPRQLRASPWHRWRCCGKLNQSPTHPNTDPLANTYHHHHPPPHAKFHYHHQSSRHLILKQLARILVRMKKLESYKSKEESMFHN
jgi:hypothetical protein